MKILKTILIVLGVLILLALLTPLVMKKDYNVVKEVVVNKPKAEVFNYIKHLKNQDNFSKWAKMDPAMVKTYRGTDGTVGFVSGWMSEKEDVGVGEQEIKKITEGERIDFELRFMKPWESTSPAFMATEAVSENETKVSWGFSGHMPYPMNAMLSFMDMEKMIGDDLATGLSNLKQLLEAAPSPQVESPVSGIDSLATDSIKK